MAQNDVRSTVHEAAARLTRATAELAALMGRKEFEQELRERGNWLTQGATEEPEWVKKWSRHWDRLKSDPSYQALLGEAAAARAALHTPEFETALEALQLGDAAGTEYALAYLEADPWYFRSGYLKGRIARWLRQVELSEQQRDRLRAALVASLRKGSRYEQVEYRKLARRFDSPDFRAELEALAASKDNGIANRAALMLRFCELNDTPGRDLRGAR